MVATSDVSVVRRRRLLGDDEAGSQLSDWHHDRGRLLFGVSALSPFPGMLFLHTLLGTGRHASGAAALNHWMEYPFDARMRRTARRAIPAGRIHPDHALAFGSTLSVAGVLYLALTVGVLASLLALVALIGYLLCYTPLKRVTPLCTLVGAVPGAVPPLIGWAAARGHLDPEAWLLFSIVFLWQFPHFMSIAWMYRDDYERAGYVVLPDGVTRDRLVTCKHSCRWWLSCSSACWSGPRVSRSSRPHRRAVLGVGFLYFGVRFTRQRSRSAARPAADGIDRLSALLLVLMSLLAFNAS